MATDTAIRGWTTHVPPVNRWRATYDLRDEPYPTPRRNAYAPPPALVARLREHPAYTRGAAADGNRADTDFYWAVETLEAARTLEGIDAGYGGLYDWADDRGVILRLPEPREDQD